MVGVAVKITEVPVQTEFADAAIETLTGNAEVTIIVTGFEVAGLPVAQDALEVSTHVITSLLTGA